MKKIIGIALALALVFGVAAASTSAAPAPKDNGGVVTFGADPGTGGV